MVFAMILAQPQGLEERHHFKEVGLNAKCMEMDVCLDNYGLVLRTQNNTACPVND
jgi:hypothetical protein